MSKEHFETFNHRDQVIWEIEVNGIKMSIRKKKNKHGELLDKTYLYTNGDGTAYYATTAFAIFSQKHFLEKLLDIKLKLKDNVFGVD